MAMRYKHHLTRTVRTRIAYPIGVPYSETVKGGFVLIVFTCRAAPVRPITMRPDEIEMAAIYEMHQYDITPRYSIIVGENLHGDSYKSHTHAQIIYTLNVHTPWSYVYIPNGIEFVVRYTQTKHQVSIGSEPGAEWWPNSVWETAIYLGHPPHLITGMVRVVFFFFLKY